MKGYLLNSKLLVVLSIVFYLISLVLPAAYINIVSDDMDNMRCVETTIGLSLLGWGWVGVIVFAVPAWFANITYYIALIVYRYSNMSWTIQWSYLTLVFALTSYYMHLQLTDTDYICFGIGFYCWLLSFILLIVACYCRRSNN